jgi:hypothetical protein
VFDVLVPASTRGGGSAGTYSMKIGRDDMTLNSETKMSSLDYWRFCRELTLDQATYLILGEDPSAESDEAWPPVGYQAVRAALLSDIKNELLRVDVSEGTHLRDEPAIWQDARVTVEHIREWLKKRGVQRGFFFPEPQGPDYLSSRHPNYSPKLAAAIRAWVAVSGNTELRKGRSVKQALDVWLRQHANEFGLTKQDGNPNEQGIQEIAKIANWDTKGGAPKTPGGE